MAAFDGVLSVDPEAASADVQGMTTYEHLVEATLAHGLMPLVVPQLSTITLGGAVTGLGIESASFRNGLPHESVLEMEVMTGDGRIVVARARQRARRPLQGLPELLRDARLRAAASHRARAGAPLRRACATSPSRIAGAYFAAAAEVAGDPLLGGRARRLHGRDSVRARRRTS